MKWKILFLSTCTVFCDSSNQIYCTVVYLRIETTFGIRVHLLVSETKVTLLKKLSMPHLAVVLCSIEQTFK